MNVSADCVLQRNEEMLFTDLGDTVVMLDAGSGIYYDLDRVGARIWALLEEPSSATRLSGVLAAEYDVTADVCRRDVLEFLERACELGIIEARTPAAGRVSGAGT